MKTRAAVLFFIAFAMVQNSFAWNPRGEIVNAPDPFDIPVLNCVPDGSGDMLSEGRGLAYHNVVYPSGIVVRLTDWDTGDPITNLDDYSWDVYARSDTEDFACDGEVANGQTTIYGLQSLFQNSSDDNGEYVIEGSFNIGGHLSSETITQVANFNIYWTCDSCGGEGAYLATFTCVSPDINGDGVVNVADLGLYTAISQSANTQRVDFFWDGEINVLDVQKMAAALYRECD